MPGDKTYPFSSVVVRLKKMGETGRFVNDKPISNYYCKVQPKDPSRSKAVFVVMATSPASAARAAMERYELSEDTDGKETK